MLKNLITVKGRQLLEQFSGMIKGHIYPIAGTINESYNQFPKQDASYLCTKTFAQYFVKQELIIPWNIVINDEDQECDMNNYVFGTHDIEVILLFRISAIETVQITISVGTLDALIEYRKCGDNNNWYTVYNEYVSVEPTPVAPPKHKTIIQFCEEHNRINWPAWKSL